MNPTDEVYTTIWLKKLHTDSSNSHLSQGIGGHGHKSLDKSKRQQAPYNDLEQDQVHRGEIWRKESSAKIPESQNISDIKKVNSVIKLPHSVRIEPES